MIGIQSPEPPQMAELSPVVVNVARFDVLPAAGAPTAPIPSEPRQTQTMQPQNDPDPMGRTQDTENVAPLVAGALHAIARPTLPLAAAGIEARCV